MFIISNYKIEFNYQDQQFLFLKYCSYLTFQSSLPFHNFILMVCLIINLFQLNLIS